MNHCLYQPHLCIILWLIREKQTKNGWVGELNFFHQFQIQKIETSIEEFYSPLVDLGVLCRKSFIKYKKEKKKKKDSWVFLVNLPSNSEAITRHCSVTLMQINADRLLVHELLECIGTVIAHPEHLEFTLEAALLHPDDISVEERSAHSEHNQVNSVFIISTVSLCQFHA